MSRHWLLIFLKGWHQLQKSSLHIVHEAINVFYLTITGGLYWSKFESDILKIKMKGKIGPTYAQEVHAETGKKVLMPFG